MLTILRGAPGVAALSLLVACSPGSAYDIEVTNGPAEDRLDANNQAKYTFSLSAVRDVSSSGVLCLSPTSAWEWVTPPAAIPQLASGQAHGPHDYTIRPRGTVSDAGWPVTFFAALGSECPASAPPDNGTTTNDSDQVVKTIRPAAPVTTVDVKVTLVDYLSVKSLSIAVDKPEPKQPPDQPIQGQPTTLTMTISNSSSVSLNVPWQMIIAGAVIVGAGTATIAPNSSADVTAPWTPITSGRVRFGGVADPAGTIDTSPLRFNNYATLDVTVASVPAAGTLAVLIPPPVPVVVAGSVGFTGPRFSVPITVCNVVPSREYRFDVSPPLTDPVPIGSPGANQFDLVADGTTSTPPCPAGLARLSAFTVPLNGFRGLGPTTYSVVVMTGPGGVNSPPFPPPGRTAAGFLSSAPVTFVVP